MSEPIAIASATPRFQLPLLFAGQAQKEFYVNEAHTRVDSLLHAACEGEAAVPPQPVGEGEMWIVSPGASGAWTGRDGALAAYQSGTWHFIEPTDGMRVYDRASGQIILYNGDWQRAASPALPLGGSTVDAEARAAITQLIDALRLGGVLPRL